MIEDLKVQKRIEQSMKEERLGEERLLMIYGEEEGKETRTSNFSGIY